MFHKYHKLLAACERYMIFTISYLQNLRCVVCKLARYLIELDGYYREMYNKLPN